MIQTKKKGLYIEILIPKKWVNKSIDTLLKDYWKVPKKLMHEWRMNKDVLINGQVVSWNIPLPTDTKLMLPVYKSNPTSIETTYMDLTVLYEDDHLLIVNKPAGVETHPSKPNQTDSLLNGVAYHLLVEGHSGEFRHIHRLDQDTTGAIVFSKHALSGAILQRMLEERLIKRSYKALVHGKVLKKKGTINANIGRDRHHATRRRVSPSGQHAVTHYKVLHYYPKKDLTLIECQLDTGRTHQIRVHLSHLGHPLAGDTLYGGQPIYHRQALHAYQIKLTHPITEEPLLIAAPFIDEKSIFPE
ncbi:RluA family pseudouridine synthase [Bacillus sp. JJ722]|uniref:RluA family pseudouridine synthase n=1 Tax=Bacillus sp. JJ722 TaxID=3122973 RepID=UPI0030007E76